MKIETHRFFILSSIILAIALAGALLLVHATGRGPGIGGDATIYISSARNLLTGEGLGLVGPQGEFRLLPYFPPFFPLVLATMGAFGLDLVAAARWLNIALFFGLSLIAGLVTLGVLRRPWLAVALSLLLSLSPVLIPVYAWAMSEPLAIFLGFLALVLLIRYLGLPAPHAQPNRAPWRWLLLSALAAGLSFLTRYIAIAFIATALLGILIFSTSRFPRRIAQVAWYALVSLLPMAAWVWIDLSRTATVASRRLDLASLGDRLSGFWQDIGQTLLFWFIPDSWLYQSPYPGSLNQIIIPLFVGLFLLWLIWLVWRLRSAARDNGAVKPARLAILLALFTLVFLMTSMLVKITTYPPITINLRMLSPLHVAVLWMLILAFDLTMELIRHPSWLRPVFIALLAVIIAWYGIRSINISDALHRNGLGYTMAEWQESETVQAVRELPAGTLIVTNQDMAVLALTGRPSYPVKEVYFDQPLEVFTRYGDGDLANDEPQRLFREGKAVLVLFDTIDDQFAGLYGDRTEERLQVFVENLYRAYRGADGGIFYYEKP